MTYTERAQGEALLARCAYGQSAARVAAFVAVRPRYAGPPSWRAQNNAFAPSRADPVSMAVGGWSE
jgi:hypothetical protein